MWDPFLDNNAGDAINSRSPLSGVLHEDTSQTAQCPEQDKLAGMSIKTSVLPDRGLQGSRCKADAKGRTKIKTNCKLPLN